MDTPWLDIPLDDYEGHMALPSIGQAGMLADHFEGLIKRYMPRSVAVLGCAGGNGLERLDPERVKRVVAVDINPDYVAATGKRHAQRLAGLELFCADVQSEGLYFGPVDLVYAALLFEYVDVAATLRTIKRHCPTGSMLAVVLQLPSQRTVSSSPYTRLNLLAPAITLIAPERLADAAAAAGFAPAESEILESPAGKRFCAHSFRS